MDHSHLITLEHGAAAAYAKERLYGLGLSYYLRESGRLDTGVFITAKPAGLTVQKLHEFETGGQYSRGWVVPFLEHIASLYVPDPYLVFQDLGSTHEEAGVHMKNKTEYLQFGPEGVYTAGQLQFPAGELFGELENWAGNAWNGVGALTRYSGSASLTVSDATEEKWARNAMIVFIGAYDLESYILWLDDRIDWNGFNMKGTVD